jgi:hypothetical protein
MICAIPKDIINLNRAHETETALLGQDPRMKEFQEGRPGLQAVFGQ